MDDLGDSHFHDPDPVDDAADDQMDDDGPPVDPLYGHPYLTFPPASQSHARCEKLRRMRIGGHETLDWDFLEEIQEAERFRQVIGHDTPWDRLFRVGSEPSYRELLVEFVSSFVYSIRPEGFVEDPAHPFVEISFRLAGHVYEMSLREFAVRTGLYTEAELDTPLYTEGVSDLDRQPLVSFWMVIATIPFGRSTGRATAIRDPMHRIMHRLIASSIVPRHRSREKVNTGDLFFLYCLLLGRTCALAACLAEYFASAYHRQQRGLLYGGSYVTVLARSLGIVPAEDHLLSAPVLSTTVGRTNLLSMRVLRAFAGVGLRFRTRDHELFVPVPLPAEAEIPVFLELEDGVPAPAHLQPQAQQQQPQAQQQPQPQAVLLPDEPIPPPPPPPPHQPPQYPQHLVQGLPGPAREIARSFHRRLRRVERVLDAIRRHLGVPDQDIDPSSEDEDEA